MIREVINKLYNRSHGCSAGAYRFMYKSENEIYSAPRYTSENLVRVRSDHRCLQIIGKAPGKCPENCGLPDTETQMGTVSSERKEFKGRIRMRWLANRWAAIRQGLKFNKNKNNCGLGDRRFDRGLDVLANELKDAYRMERVIEA
ncbi:hypothetical protein Btru_058209 [Bulinus truncatus]|nr:hypothetical protein Btru_058209 [Bulinus truncatus]